MSASPHGSLMLPMAIVLLAVVLVPASQVYRGLRTGTVSARGAKVSRRDRPGLFWAVEISYVVIGSFVAFTIVSTSLWR